MSLVSKTVRKLAPLGGYALARQLCRKQPRILMYHRFPSTFANGRGGSEFFERQVKYIREHYQPYTLAGLIQYADQHGKMPEHAVVITVDDGYRDFYDVAFPILRKHGVPATLYATTGFVDGRLWLWPDKVTWVLENAREVVVDAKIGSVMFHKLQSCENLYNTYWRTLIAYGLSIPDDEKQAFISDLAGVFGLELPEATPEEFTPISWDQLREVEAAGMEVGGHTVTHPTLGQVTEAQAQYEIYGCRDELIEHLGDKPRTFCYPNGQPSDFQDFLLPMVEQAGYLGAVTAFPDSKGIENRFAMRRHACGDNEYQFLKAVSGVEYLGHRVRGEAQNV